ncbi:MAG: right-handed parallel beta-helix repeat-containing protein, partial [Candidatus Thorarchaeota archaeon]
DTTTSGLVLYNVANGIIVNNTFNLVANGIYIQSSSSNNYVLNNTLIGGLDWGIIISDSSENYVEDNTILEYGGGFSMGDSSLNTVRNNTCLDPTGTGFQFVNSNNNTIDRNTCTLADRGFNIGGQSSINRVEYNTITGCVIGIQMMTEGVTENYIASNIVNGNLEGMYIRDCISNIIYNNTCNDNFWQGIKLEFALENTLTNNTCSYNDGTGIIVYRGEGPGANADNTLVNNTCNYNDYYGISISFSSSNIITHNTMAQNGVNGLRFTSDPCYGNTVRWNTLLYNTEANVYDDVSGGIYSYNYYSDYSGIDANGDGIGDSSYVIEVYHSYDFQPLMISINWPYLDTLPPYWNVTLSDYYSPTGNVSYQLDAFDVFGLDTWWIDDVGNFAINTDGLITSTLILTDGTYPVEVGVSDTNDNIAEYAFAIMVDTVAPTVDEPTDIFYEIGTGPEQVLWSPDDDNPSSYNLYLNNELWVSTPWSGEDIYFDVENLAYGTHNVTLVVFDMCGHSNSDTVLVHAIDSTLPEVTCWHSPPEPTDEMNITITSSVVDATDIVEVVLSYSIVTPTSWTNVTMVTLGDDWTYTLPTYPTGTVIFYKCYALDTGGNWGVSEVYNVTIAIISTTTTPTTTTTTPSSTTTSTTSPSTTTTTTTITTSTSTMSSTTITTTTSPSTSTTTNTTTPPPAQDLTLFIVVVGGGAFFIVIVLVIVSVRKQRAA